MRRILTGSLRYSLPQSLDKIFGFVAYPFNNPLWYLYAVFFLALLSPALLLCFRSKKTAWAAVLAITVFLAVSQKLDIPVLSAVMNHGYIPNTLYYLPAYLSGAFFGYFYPQLDDHRPLACLLSLPVTALVLEALTPGIFFATSIKILPLLLLVLLPAVPALGNLKIYKLTFLIYALHAPVLRVFKEPLDVFFLRFSLPASVLSLLTAGITLCLVIVLAAAIYLPLKKYAPKVLLLLTGGRG